MNHIYRSIWSETLGAWIAVSENTKSKGKCSNTRNALLASGLLVCSANSWALPTGEQLTAGQVSISTATAGQMQIDQTSQQAIVNWQGFSIAPNEVVNIQQPNAQAALLNRVVGQDASQIQGQLNANGQVYLVNPNGVVFGKTAQVDVGGLVASTHNISNADFLNGNHHFTQDGATGTVENHGTINTPDGGVVALICQSVTNTGTINTPKGTTALAAGKTVDLDFQGNGLVEVKVSEAALNAQITNQGAIQADGGRVVLTAQAAGQLIDSVINQQGIVRAQSMVERNGEIILDGGNNGITQVSGSLNTDGQVGGKISVTGQQVQINNGAIVTASGNAGGGAIVIGDKLATSQTTIGQGATVNAQALNNGNAGTINVFASMNNGTVNVAGNLNTSALNNGNGGFIDTSAAHVKIADSAKISTQATNGKTGTWLIDPADFNIAASGGDITGSALSASLKSTGITIFSTSGASGVNGDVNVNDAVTWTANNQLTLNAQRNININANISGAGKLFLQYGQGNLGGDYFINNGVTINLLAGQNFSTQLAGAVTDYTVVTTSAGLQAMNSFSNYALGKAVSLVNFSPVDFNASFVGLGNTITNTGKQLFNLNNGTIRDIKVIGSVSGTDFVSGLVGANNGTISNASSSSSVTGASNIGGLVGYNGGTVNNSSATGIITGTSDFIGGLVGLNDGTVSNSSFATGSVSSNTGSYLGGLVGLNNAVISNSSATGSVSSTSGNYVGGLVGQNYTGTINNVSASSNVQSNGDYIGGLVGQNNGVINNATLIITGNGINSSGSGSRVGGLVGYNTNSISNATVTVTSKVTSSSGYAGGLVGGNDGTISNASTTVTGSVSGTYAGGLVGTNNNGTISNSSVTGTGNVSSAGTVGGLVGYNGGNISNAYVNTALSITNNGNGGYAGGLVGGNNGTISSSYAVSNVSGTVSNQRVGGLAGYNGGNINIAYATGNVNSISGSGTGSSNSGIGGLVGVNGGSISNAYATGSASGSGSNNIGGLVGYNSGSISNTYATGSVSGSFSGGLIGWNDGSISNSFWDTQTTNQSIGAGGNSTGTTGKTTAEMTQFLNFSNAGWDIAKIGGSSAVWRIYDGFTAPLLRFWLTPLTVDSAQNPVVYSIANVDSSGHLFNIANSGFLYSDQQGYDISGTILTNSISNPILNEDNVIPNGGLIASTDPGPITSDTGAITSGTSTIAPKSDEASHNACDNLGSDSKCNNGLSIDDDLPKLQVKNSAGKVLRSELSADRQFLTLLLEDGSVRVWDFKSGMQRNIATSNDKQTLTDISAVTDNNEVWVASKTGISIYDVMGSLIKDKAINQPAINHFVTNTLGNPFLVNSGDGNLSLRTWEDNQQHEHWQKSYKDGAGYLAINEPSSDDIRTAVLIHESFIYELKKPLADNRDALKPLTDAVDIIDAFNKDKLVHLRNLHENIIFTRFKDNDTLQLGLANGELSDWSIKTGSKKATVANFSEAVAVLDHDKETYAYITENGIVQVRNAQGFIQLSIQNQESPLKDVKLIDDAKKLLTVLENGNLAIWDIASGKRMLRLFSTKKSTQQGEGGWTVIDELGRFDGSIGATNDFSWVANDEDIPLESFSENYFEPGLLTSVLQNQDYLIKNPKSLEEEIALPPKVDLEMLANQQSKGDKVVLQLKVYDRGGGIDDIKITQNGKTLPYKDAVTEQSTQQGSDADRVLMLNITPNPGKNTIKVVASNGINDSSPSEINFDSATKPYAPTLHFLSIGIDKYEYSIGGHLNTPVAGAALMKETLEESSEKQQQIDSELLTDENATKKRILEELKKLSQGAQQDKLVVYMSGHGKAVKKEWYFAPYGSKNIENDGITATELSKIFKDSKIQHILLIIDSCNSGAGMDSFQELKNVQNLLARRLSHSPGLTVIAAARRNQSALGTLLTDLIIPEIKKRKDTITAHGIADYIELKLPEFSKKRISEHKEEKNSGSKKTVIEQKEQIADIFYDKDSEDFMLTNFGDKKK